MPLYGELDVIDIELHVQATDQAASVEQMDKYLALASTEKRKFFHRAR